MRNLPALCFTLCSLLTLSAPLYAAGDGEWFGAIKASIGEDTIDNITDMGTIGTGVQIGNDIDGKIKDDEVDDYTAGIGLAFGRRFGYWQLSAEFVYRYRTDWDIEAPTPSIQTITNVFNNVETNTLLINLARRGPISQYWSWELGAGAGIVDHDIESEYVEREVPGVSPELKLKDNAGDTEFTYNVFAGLTRDLGGPWTLNIRYRYIDLGELEAGPYPGRAVRVSADHQAHEVQFSLERDF